MFNLKPSKMTEACGWYGMSAILLAYALVSFNIIDSETLIFQSLNLTGAIGLIIVASSKGVIQSVILNIVWLIVALAAIASIIL